MADNHASAGGHPDMDYAEHERTYRGFIFAVKWAVIAHVIALPLMAFFLL